MLGRVLTLPVAMLFGPWAGAAAAAIAGGALYGASFAPLLVIALVAEAMSVGISVQRHKFPLIAGGFVWALASLLLLFAPHLYGADYLRDTIWPIAMRLPVNGLVGIALADLIVSAASAKGLVPDTAHARRRTLRAHAFHGFVDRSPGAPPRRPARRRQPGEPAARRQP